MLHLDGVPAGGFTNWRDGRGWETWRFDGGLPLRAGERDALRARIQAGRAQCQAEAARRHHIARQRASRYWHRASAAPRNHPYLIRKGVQACGLRVYRSALVVPVQDADGVLHSLQFIEASGAKRFLKGGRVQGLRYWIGGNGGDTVCVAEGFATGASVWEATGHAVAVAFHAGNLEPVARSIREAYPKARIVVCADDDHATPGNPGMTQARQAARAVGGGLAIPAFGSARAGEGGDFVDLNRPSRLFTAQTTVRAAAEPPARPTLTDFNDLHRHAGLLAVLTAVQAAAHPSGAERASAAGEGPAVDDWPDPEPLTEAIKHRRRRGQDTAQEEESLDALAREAPVAIPVPRLLYADATPEALAHGLGTGWPTGGVLSAEAGAVFGAHGMGYETVLRNLALLNVLWDGGEIAVDRRSKPSFQLRDRRLTFGLMVQPDALRGFLERAGALPRGTGFIARFLIAWPASTQGTRTYRSTPASTPAVDRFAGRITALLDMPLPTDSVGGLNPMTLDLSPAARAAWIRAHDDIESGLGVGGDYQSVRDVAAKAAENVARLAALFHVLAHGPTGSVGVDAIEGAVRIVGWHLHEARRLVADLDTPPALAAAIRLDTWLLNEARATGSVRIPTTRVYQYGPACVRDGRDLKAALATLTERGRARMEEVGRRRFVVVNPALVDGGSMRRRE